MNPGPTVVHTFHCVASGDVLAVFAGPTGEVLTLAFCAGAGESELTPKIPLELLLTAPGVVLTRELAGKLGAVLLQFANGGGSDPAQLTLDPSLN